MNTFLSNVFHSFIFNKQKITSGVDHAHFGFKCKYRSKYLKHSTDTDSDILYTDITPLDCTIKDIHLHVIAVVCCYGYLLIFTCSSLNNQVNKLLPISGNCKILLIKIST